MFGGLAVKGDDAKDDSSSAAPPPSSGFSFMATPNETAAQPTSTSEESSSAVEGGQQSSVSLGAPGGSGFSFLAGGSAETNNVKDSTANNTNGSAPQPASMFAGLNNTPAAANNSESQGGNTEPAAAAAASGSGFSFMSSSATSAVAPPQTEAKSNVEAASNVSTAGSSFGFMNSMMSSSDENGEQKEAGADIAKEESAAAAPASSGFSFLSGGSVGNSAPPPPSDDTMASQSPSLVPQSETSSQGSSMFAGLNTTVTETKITENNNATTAPPPPPPAAADSDLLSMPSPALPATSGVSWGAPPGVGGAKKIVKKKRGKRVGVGSAAAAAAAVEQTQQQPPPQQPVLTESNNVNGGMSTIPAPEPSSFQPPPPLSTDTYAPSNNNPPVAPPMYQPSPTASQIKTGTEDQPHVSPPMRVKAEMAMQNAEEFIKEKQRSAIAMAAERAMNDKATSENGSSGGWKIGAAPEPATLSPKDSEYQAAKAAAEEARTMSATKGKTSLFSGSLVSGVSGFFGRKSPPSSATDVASTASYSSHGGVVNNTLDPVRRANSNPSQSTTTSLSPTKEGEEHPSIDPIQRENDETRRAAAERDMAAFREKQMQEQERLAEAKREEEKKRLEQERLRQLEEQAKRRSPKEKLQAALDHFADVTRTSTDHVTQLRAKRAELVKERMEAEKTERFAAQQVSYAEAQQTQAAEEEDFEAADRLASDIERHTLEKNKQTAIVKSIDDSISQLDEQRDAACKAVVACFSDVNSKLKELQREVDDREKEDEVLNQFANTSKRLSSETERLSSDLKHIERDESVLADEQKELESKISEETKEFEEKRVEASEKLEVVNEEIEELRKKLAEAEEKAATLNNEISSCNTSIQSVRSKYSRQLGRLEKKEQSVKESRAEWQVEHDSVEKAKAAHESVVAAHSEEMLTREKIIDEIKVEVTASHDFEDIVTSAFDATEVIGDDNEAFDSDVVKYEAAVDEANNNVISAESKIQSLQEEISAFDVRVPILEAEKKVAAAKRDFKAAGKASKEIKDAIARKEQCEAELSGEAMERKQAAKEELRKVTLLLEETKSIAAEKVKESSLKRMETLRERIAHLQSVVKELAIEPADSDSINVACVGAFVIDSQISVLEAEGKALGEKYGGWEADAVEESSNAADEVKEVEDDVTSDAVIDDDTLQEYAMLAAEVEELETKIDQAAAEEDYDTATELEEKAESLRSKIKSLGHSPEKMAQALKDKDAASGESEPPSNKSLDESVVDKYASLKAQVKQLEADIETAVAADNFDDAAELEERLQVTKTEIESLGFSVDELEEALQNGSNKDADEAEAVPDATEPTEDTADIVSETPSDDVDAVVEEANNTKENEMPEADGNDAKVAQTPSEPEDARDEIEE